VQGVRVAVPTITVVGAAAAQAHVGNLDVQAGRDFCHWGQSSTSSACPTASNWPLFALPHNLGSAESAPSPHESGR
jgi:hypothetical protein